MADYTVQAGDTLSKIAKAHGTTVSELAKQNGIKDVNKIEIGQELSLGKTTVSAPKPQQEQTVGLDTLETQSKKDSTDLVKGTALGFGAAYVGAHVYDDVKKYAPKVKAKTVKAYAHMKATAKQNANAVKSFVAQKAGETKTQVKTTAMKTKTRVQTAAAKTKTVAGRAAQKAKVAGRYTRFIANTKVAPKLIRGASRCAGPLAAIYGMYEVKTAYDKGGEKAAVRQAVKTGGGLAGGWAGAKIGASLGSFAGPVGTVIGGVAGGILGYCLGEKLCS